MAKVYNHYHKDAPKDAIDIGRPSSFGNPFIWKEHGPVSTVKVSDREESIRCFALLLRCYKEADIKSSFLILNLTQTQINILFAKAEWIRTHLVELVNKDLVCWCAPLPCHGDVLLRFAANLKTGGI